MNIRKLNLSPKDIRIISEQLNSSESLRLEPFIECDDHTVSRETFSLFREADLDLLVTQPQPSVERLPDYYESEDYISHTDSKRNLTEKLYQIVKNHSLKRKLKLINQVSEGKGKLLDVGCGTGDFLKKCQLGGWFVSGVEPNQKARSLAESKIGATNCHSSIEELLNLDRDTFDVISMWHVLEHIPDLYVYLTKIKTLLRSNGCLIVAVPNFNSYDAQHYGTYWAGYDVPRHLWHFSRTSIERIFSNLDMVVVEELPLYFDSFYVSMLSEKYKHGKQNYASAFYRGLRSNWKARMTGEYSSLIYLIRQANT